MTRRQREGSGPPHIPHGFDFRLFYQTGDALAEMLSDPNPDGFDATLAEMILERLSRPPD